MNPSLAWRIARAVIRGPRVKGRDRLFLELRRFIKAPPGLVRAKTSDGLTWELDIGEDADARLYVYGDFDADTLQVIYGLVSASSVVMDVGANIGCVAVPLANRGVTVHAFEPTPAVHRRLERNLEINDCISATAVRAALGSTLGTGRLVEPVPHRSVENRVLPNGSDVQILTIDSYCSDHGLQPTLLKIDVEGSEWEVLRGAPHTLRDGPHLILEVNSDTATERGFNPMDMLAWLSAGYGYEFRLITQAGLRPARWAPEQRILGNVLGLAAKNTVLFDQINRALTQMPRTSRFPIY